MSGENVYHHGNSMQIIFDHQIFSHQDRGGISRCFTELMLELGRSRTASYELPILFSSNVYLRELKHNYLRFSENHDFRGKHRLMYELNKIYTHLRFLTGKCDFDIFHPTYHDPYFLSLLRGRPFAITAHDMIMDEAPELLPGASKILKGKKLLADLASVIITPSVFTKEKLLEHYRLDADKIHVVAHGPPCMHIPDAENMQFPQKYFLYVGHRLAYKNFHFLLKAFSHIRKDFPDLMLLCAGGGKLAEEEKYRIEDLSLKNFVIQANLSDSQLAFAYKNALAYICPSKCEGFGIPILEAFSYSCPVLLARVASLPEVAGDAACYFDPEDQEGLVKAMMKTLSSESFRKMLREKGNDRLKNFSAEKNARGILTAYEAAISRPRGTK